MAHLSEDTCGELISMALKCHEMLVDPDVIASAVLDPAGAVAFEAALLGALDGAHGLTHVAGEVGLRALELRTAAVEYQARDAASGLLFELDTFFDTAMTAADLPFTVLDTIDALLHGDDLKSPWQRLLADHPGFTDAVIDDLPLVLFLASRGRIPPTGAGIARLLGLLYPDGHARVADLPFVDPDGIERLPPRTMADLLAALQARNAQHPGQIDVRVLTSIVNGSLQRSYIVDVPGMDDFSLLPGKHPGGVIDVPTSLHVMAGDRSTYAAGIAEALHRAGADQHDPVMLVGHSQGGMTAVRAAHDFVADGSFNVTHVITAGSPVAHMSIPDSVQALSIENSHDVVPHLDGADNPGSPNRTTVTFDRAADSVGDNHSMRDTYLPVGAALDASQSASLRAFLDSVQPYFSAATVDNHAYRITREY